MSLLYSINFDLNFLIKMFRNCISILPMFSNFAFGYKNNWTMFLISGYNRNRCCMVSWGNDVGVASLRLVEQKTQLILNQQFFVRSCNICFFCGIFRLSWIMFSFFYWTIFSWTYSVLLPKTKRKWRYICV